MAKQLTKLVAKINTYDAQLNLFVNYINHFDEHAEDHNNIINLEKRLKNIESIIDKYQDTYTEIISTESGSESENLERMGLFQDLFFEYVGKAESIISKFNKRDVKGKNSDFLEPVKSNVNVKLPKINLPVFDGSFLKWREFEDQFKNLVHNNNEISNSQKLSYLKLSVKGDALNLLGSLEIIETNYAIAWERLKNRYDNKRRIINNHVQSVIEMSPISKESASQLLQLINIVQNNLDCLINLKVPVDQWDAILVPIIVSKLDIQSVKEWEIKLNHEMSNDDIPTLKSLLEFLKRKQQTLEAVQCQNVKVNSSAKRDVRSLVVSNEKKFCFLCKGEHFLNKCEQFLKLNADERFNKIRELKICINCFRKGHFANNCKSVGRCFKCKRKHHTLLHINPSNEQATSSINANLKPQAETCESANFSLYDSTSEVFLSTAVVLVEVNGTGEKVEARVVLDSASQSHFITKCLQERLGLKTIATERRVKGINGGQAFTYEQVNVKIKSRVNNYHTTIQGLVLNEIIPQLPVNPVKINKEIVPAHIKLADPEFDKSAPVDILLGASLFYDLLCIGQIKRKEFPTLQKTVFGWVVSGELAQNPSCRQICSFLTINQLNETVEKFWNIDEFITAKRMLTVEEQYCEELFSSTTTRNYDGRFVVKIPFRNNFERLLGDSTEEAKKRFISLEKRFISNPNLREKYVTFMNEYINLGHMEKIDNIQSPGFYLPHHCVINEVSDTTKLRVVFDGSCKARDGLNINNVQLTGPTIQNELFAIIINFRMHKFVLTADIAKMYRQVLVHREHTKFQRIFWRTHPSEPISTYELKTVTYGTTAAPYLAIRSLMELANDFENQFPCESKIIRECFYVDDVLLGCETIQDLLEIKENLSTILSTGGFELRKWTSNAENLHNLTLGDNDVQLSGNVCKKLGIWWNPNKDTFTYKLSEIKSNDVITKRTILASVAQMFDPLGLLAPVLVLAKLIVQDLWKMQLNWDDPVPDLIRNKYFDIRDQLQNLNNLEIDRHVIIPGSEIINLHAFSDASEQGYGSCIYLQSIKNENIKVSLLVAKSRVAPIKFVSIPRLELCAAVISAQLMDKIKAILNIKINHVYYWTDSMITLGWIKSSPNKFQTYVANRVTEIQTLSNPKDWNHINTKDNPADLISRGLLPNELISDKKWWCGPTILRQPQIDTSLSESIPFPLPEEKKKLVTLVTTEFVDIFSIENYSSLFQLKRIVAYCIRFISNARIKSEQRQTGHLTVKELSSAIKLLIKIKQQEHFFREIAELKKRNTLNSKSKLLSLCPFLDENNIMRVGGRLSLSKFTYDKKYPIILPKSDHLTTLIFRETHVNLLHGGPNLLLNTIREQFWPINGRSTAKKTVRGCIKCFRFNCKPNFQIMGNLPKERTQAIYPFFTTGIDYAGPFLLKQNKGRGNQKFKAYVALFVCFSTKAMHLELVSELSTNAFIAMFRRFISRRGKPSKVFSDNGTNFVGANRELTELYNFLNNNETKIINTIAQDGISWHFMPPYGPNFGGLWEAGVKNVKHHIKRVVQNALLTYENFYTLIVQIESVLNSRPLTPLSADPNDLEVLTPAHFLIGRKFTSIPDPDLTTVPLNRLDNFQFIQVLKQHFWQRWAKEYISELQQRTKWKQTKIYLKLGDLVLIKEDNLPAARWQLGRIIGVHPGVDGVPRVATIKCQSGEITRPISKICVLPIETANSSQGVKQC